MKEGEKILSNSVLITSIQHQFLYFIVNSFLVTLCLINGPCSHFCKTGGCRNVSMSLGHANTESVQGGRRAQRGGEAKYECKQTAEWEEVQEALKRREASQHAHAGQWLCKQRGPALFGSCRAWVCCFRPATNAQRRIAGILRRK